MREMRSFLRYSARVLKLGLKAAFEIYFGVADVYSLTLTRKCLPNLWFPSGGYFACEVFIINGLDCKVWF